MTARTRPSRSCGFTLLELLVSSGIITTLLATLLPVVAKLKATAQSVQCKSNLRQIAMGLIAYASDNNGHFPPTLYAPAPGMFWFDQDRVGKYLSSGGKSVPVDKVLRCPSDENALRSYAINIWSSSKVDSWVSVAEPAAGVQWSLGSKRASNLILVTEAWSNAGSPAAGYSASAAIGLSGTSPARRFGGDGGIAPPVNEGRWGLVNCELPFQRHRTSGNGQGTAPIGNVNIAYADGHVAARSDADLVNKENGLSTLDSLWTPNDSQANH